MFLLLALLLLVFVPSPWNLAAAFVSALLGAAEVLFWERRMRRHKVRTGIDELVGSTGQVTAPLDPVGQIIVRGELWEAHSPIPMAAGARVRVVRIEDPRLEVRPVEESASWAAGSAAVLLVVLALAGCGGDEGPNASEEYADGVCSSLSTWADDVETTVKTLADQGLSIDEQDVRSAIDDVKAANEELTDDLDGLGAPETEDGEQAEQELDDLATALSAQVDKVDEALDSGSRPAAIAGIITSAVATGATAVNSAYQNLRQLDPAGELRDAFEDSDECKQLEDQLERDND
jgi:membrane protein implicated in regulation of membrane protease activity